MRYIIIPFVWIAAFALVWCALPGIEGAYGKATIIASCFASAVLATITLIWG